MRRWQLVLGRWWLIPLAALILDWLLVLFVLPAGPARDEAVFYPAALAFAKAGAIPGLDLLRHYPAPQAPLSFYLAGRWLALVPGLWPLRVLDSLLMSAALLRFSWFAQQRFARSASLATALLALNPYFHLVATHFYTDALYFLLVVLVLTRWPARGAWLPLTLLPLVRQFGLIFALGEALHAVLEKRLRAALLALLTLAPLCLLFVLWRGFAPDVAEAQVAKTVHAEYGWFFPYIATYHVAALGFYLAPVAWRVPHPRRFWWAGSIAALAYLLAPAHPNFSALLSGSGITRLGYFHQAALLLGPRAAHGLICCFAFIGGGLVLEALVRASKASLIVGLFIVLSAFNFQAWDKYVLDVLPALLIAVFTNPRPAQAAILK